MQIVDDRATAQIEEILAQAAIACAWALPPTHMCKRMLNGHPLAQFVAAFGSLLALA